MSENVVALLFIPAMLLLFCFTIAYFAWRQDKIDKIVLDKHTRIGEKPMKFDVIPLTECPDNSTVWVEFLDCGGESKKRLADLDIIEDAYLQVISTDRTGTRLRNQKNTAIKLGPISADMVLVRILRHTGRWTKQL